MLQNSAQTSQRHESYGVYFPAVIFHAELHFHYSLRHFGVRSHKFDSLKHLLSVRRGLHHCVPGASKRANTGDEGEDV